MKEAGATKPGAGVPVAALLLAVLLAVPSLFARGLMPPDETRYADVALAMQESGDWLVPRLHQKWYFEKPPVFFWAIAGMNELGVPVAMAPRLVSILAALGIVGLLPALARGFGSAAGSARRAAFVLVTLPLFAIYAQLGFIDVLLAFEVALAAACKLARGRLPPERRAARVAWSIGEGAVVALAILTKGPVVLVFVAALRLGAALSRSAGGRAPGAFDRLDLVVLAVSLAGAAGWLAAAAGRAGGDYAWQITLGQLQRRIAGTERKHHVVPGFLVAVVAAGGLPWTLLALWSAAPWRWRDAMRPPARLAGVLAWGVVPVVAIAFIPTQQPHYALPALPALALLAGEALAFPVRRGAARAAAAFGIVTAAGLLAAAAFLGPLLHRAAIDAAVAQRMEHDQVLRAAIVIAGLGALVAVAWRRPGSAVNVPLRAIAGLVAFFLALPLASWRIDDVMTARTLVESPALVRAQRIVAPTGIRSSIRLRTRLPLIEEYDGRDLEMLVRDDPKLVAVEWRDDLARSGLLDRLIVVARGFLRGRELVAVRAPLRDAERDR